MVSAPFLVFILQLLGSRLDVKFMQSNLAIVTSRLAGAVLVIDSHHHSHH